MWKHGTTEFHRTLPIAFMIVCLSVAGIGSLEDGERREWSARIKAPINEAVDQLKQPEYLWPWLLVDVENAQQATSLSISINGEQVKAPGTSMSVWEGSEIPRNGVLMHSCSKLPEETTEGCGGYTHSQTPGSNPAK